MKYFLMLSLFSTLTLASPLPSQFLSDDAAIILGLESKNSITVELIRKTAKKLRAKYHPDKIKYNNLSLSIDELTQISQKIASAETTLLKYLRNGGQSYYEERNSNSSSGTSSNKKAHTKGDPWGQEFRQKHSGYGVVQQGWGNSFTQTIFEDVPTDTSEIFMHLRGYSPIIGFDTNLIIVVHKDSFPILEARLYQRRTGDREGLPTLVSIQNMIYQRRHHAGGSGARTDAFVFEDGSYLIPKSGFLFRSNRIPNSPPGTYEANFLSSSYMIEFGASGSNSRNQSVFKLEEGESIADIILPKVTAGDRLSWRELKITDSMDVIQLPPPKAELSEATVKKFLPQRDLQKIRLIIDSSKKLNLEHQKILQTATQLVLAAVGDEYQIELSSISRTLIDDVDIIISPLSAQELYETKAALEKQGIVSRKISLNSNADGYSYLMDTEYGTKVIVALAMDKIWYQPNVFPNDEDPMSFAKTIVSIAHELYGNALPLYEKNKLSSVKKTQLGELSQSAEEVKAYARGIRLLNRLIDGFFSQNNTEKEKVKIELPSKLKSELRELLLIEEKRMNGWQEAHRQEVGKAGESRVVNFRTTRSSQPSGQCRPLLK